MQKDRTKCLLWLRSVVRKKYSREGKHVEQESDVYDLRLFRDGQLVGYFPDEGGEVDIDPITGKRVVAFNNIQLPTVGDKETVTFTAYAFNCDRVKSSTASKEFTLSTDMPKRKSRAYVIAIGVNAYENPAWDLRYAANDAVGVSSIVTSRLQETGSFDEVICIPLVSQYKTDAGGNNLLIGVPVTEEMVQDVLSRLAGGDGNPSLLNAIPNVDKLRQATPDDLVMITYSGHGFADDRGQFHLFPYDIGKGDSRIVDEELLRRTISSEELSHWLRDVDAGEMMMVIDACNSAASVEGGGFKPGPMGSRGLGQLAYDKSMRILTASQAEFVALESDMIGHGALTYALIREGLDADLADNEPKDQLITANEWLRYGMARVPSLYSEILSGKVKSAGRSLDLPLSFEEKRQGSVQQPGLFDFRKQKTGGTLFLTKARPEPAIVERHN